MTKTKAQTVAAALMSAGEIHSVTVSQRIDGEWTVKAQSTGSVSAASVATFATNQAVSGYVITATFV